METIILKPKNKRDISRIVDFAQKSNIEMKIKEKSEKKLAKIKKKEAIMQLSKEINKSMHEKYIKPILDDYYNR